MLHPPFGDRLPRGDQPPLVAYHSPNPDAVSRKICYYIAELIPDGSVVQIGFGSIPESVTSFLKDYGNFARDNPILEMHPASFAANPVTMGKFKNFISINSAVQVGLWGQANSEAVGDLTISGVGDVSTLSKAPRCRPEGRPYWPSLQLTVRTGNQPSCPGCRPVHLSLRPGIQYSTLSPIRSGRPDGQIPERTGSPLIAIARPEWRDRL